MREQIYTIDINDAFDAREGCPLCALTVKYENTLYEYILGPAMMEPDVRIETNRDGFCHRHLQGMAARKNKLSFALILESLLMEINKKPSREISSHRSSCYLCRREDKYLALLLSNVAQLWRKEPEFARKWETVQGFCLPHTGAMTDAAVRELGKKQGADFARETIKAAARHAAALQDSVTGFCRSFDHRSAGQPFDKNAVDSACMWLGGTRR